MRVAFRLLSGNCGYEVHPDDKFLMLTKVTSVQFKHVRNWNWTSVLLKVQFLGVACACGAVRGAVRGAACLRVAVMGYGRTRPPEQQLFAFRGWRAPSSTLPCPPRTRTHRLICRSMWELENSPTSFYRG